MAVRDRPGRERQGRRVDAPEHRHGGVDSGTNRGRDPEPPLTLAEFRMRGQDRPVGGRENQTRNRIDLCSVRRRRVEVEVVRGRPCSDNQHEDRSGQNYGQEPASVTGATHFASVSASPHPRKKTNVRKVAGTSRAWFLLARSIPPRSLDAALPPSAAPEAAPRTLSHADRCGTYTRQ